MIARSAPSRATFSFRLQMRSASASLSAVSLARRDAHNVYPHSLRNAHNAYPHKRNRILSALPLLLALVDRAAAQPSSSSCAQACSCRAIDIANMAYKTHRAARALTRALETGLLDTAALEELQTEVGNSAVEMRQWSVACSAPGASCATHEEKRSCACRPLRLFNLTTIVQRKLDDAAAGALFGDSDANMAVLTSTTPHILHTMNRVGSEAERIGRIACGGGLSSSSSSSSRRRGGGGGGGGRRFVEATTDAGSDLAVAGDDAREWRREPALADA